MRFPKLFILYIFILFVSAFQHAFSMKDIDLVDQFTHVKDIDLTKQLGLGDKAISQDEKYIATESFQKVSVLNLQTGELVCSYSHKDFISRVFLCIKKEKKYVVSRGSHGIKVFDILLRSLEARDRQNAGEVQRKRQDDMSSKIEAKEDRGGEIYSCERPETFIQKVSLSEDGKYIALGWMDGTVQVIKIFQAGQDDKGKIVFECQYYGNSIGAILLTKNYLVLGFSGVVYVIDFKKQKELFVHNIPRAMDVTCICTDAREKYLAFGTSNGVVEVIDMQEKKRVFSYIPNKGFRSVECIYLSKCGKYVALGFYNSGVKVFNIGNNKELFSYDAYIHVYHMLLSQDGRYVAFGGCWEKGKYRVNVFDMQTFRPFALRQAQDQGGPAQDIRKKVCSCCHDASICSMLFSDDGQRFITVGRCGKVVIHETSENFRLSRSRYMLDKKDRKERIASIKNNDFQTHNFMVALGGKKQQKFNCCKSFLM